VGILNTDLNKRNPASDLMNNFASEHALHRCTNMKTPGKKRFTYLYNDTQGSQSEIDFFLCNDMHVVLDSDVLDVCCILSDHIPILVECTITASTCSCFRPPVARTISSHSLTSISSCVGIMLISHVIATCVNLPAANIT